MDVIKNMKSKNVPKPELLLSTMNGYGLSSKDMKSLLPGYDEAADYTYRHNFSKINSGAIPKAGRTIDKLNIEELPLQFTGGEYLQSSQPTKNKSNRQDNSTKPSKNHEKIFEKYDLMSKFDASVFNPDTRLTQMAAARLKTDIKKQTPTKQLLSKMVVDNNNSSRPSMFKIKSNVVDDIESELGFGFRSHISNQNPQSNSGERRIRRPPPPRKKNNNNSSPPQKEKAGTLMAVKNAENSIKALKKKINNKREQWTTEEFGWDGYNYQGNNNSNEFKNATKLFETNKSKSHPNHQQSNEKLSAMSRKFKQSLKINTDMRQAIKTPKSSNQIHSSSSSKVLEGDGFEEHDLINVASLGADKNTKFEDEYDETHSSLLTRSSALYVPEKKNAQKNVKNTTKRLDSSSVSHKNFKMRTTAHDSEVYFVTEDDVLNKNLGDSAGVMKLRSLLEMSGGGGLEKFERKFQKDTPDIDDDINKPIDFSKLKQATSTLAHGKWDSSKEKVDMATSPRTSVVETRVMSENFYTPTTFSSSSRMKTASASSPGRKDKVPPIEDFIKERLGESVKTVDDASIIARRLGSLMTRVAMSREQGGQSQNDGGSTNEAVDTVRLAKELRELAASMEKDYGTLGDSSGQTTDSVETQTERNDNHSKNLPQPKFTKHMSYTDQLVLRKLREIRKNFEN